ncbi:MAG: carbohydrate ABC transporter permease [Acidimicrobiales bacterium]
MAEVAIESAAPPARAARRTLADRDGFLGAAFLLPSVLYIVGLVAFPFFLAIAFSLSDVRAGDFSYDFVGLENFRDILGDSTFRRALLNTVVLTVATMAIVVVVARALALVLTANFRGKRLVRFLVLLPWTTPVALSAITWLGLLDSLFSPIDWILRELGLLPPLGHMIWLGKPGLAMGSVIAVHVWRIVPLAAVIIMAGLTAIPDEIRDAADVDGAGFWRKQWEIEMPLTLPVTAVATLFGGILTFTDLAVVRVLTRGGPVRATETLPSWAFSKGIDGGQLAQGAAIALFLFPLLLVAAVAILRAVRRMEVT